MCVCVCFRVPASVKAEWQNAFRNSAMYVTINLSRWLLIYPGRAQRETMDFLRALKQVARQMNFIIEEPEL